MNINFLYDPSVQNAPAGFKTALAAAATYLDQLILDPITVNIAVGWGEDSGYPVGEALATGGPVSGENLGYSQIRAALAAHATSAADATALANLPASDPIGGGSYFVAAATAKALGLLPADGAEIDGSIGFSTTAPFAYDPNARAASGQYDFIATAEHEITHALGRVSAAAPMQLFRYSAPGVLALTPDQPAYFSPAYFSIDGGATDLGDFDTTSDDSDWAPGLGADAFDAYADPDSENPITPRDVTLLDVLGFTVDPTLAPSTAAVLDLVAGGRWVTTPAGQSTQVTDRSGGGNVVVSQGSDTVNAGSGPITVLGAASGSAELHVALGSGDALVFLTGEAAQITLGTGAATIVGGAGPLNIRGSLAPGGEDTIFGASAGLTSVYGGSESMVFVGGGGRSVVMVGLGGGIGFSGPGGGTLVAMAPDTALVGAVDGDRLFASAAGGDVLAAGAGNETLNGAGANGPDVFFGGSGSTLVELGHGDDQFAGGTGTATVVAGTGNAILWVGPGPDTFRFTAGLTRGGADVIAGFRPGVDHLNLFGYSAAPSVQAANGSSIVHLADGTQITLLGVSAGASVLS